MRFLVPDSRLVIRKVAIPKDIKDDEIKGYLYLEMGTSIHLPFEEPIFDVVLLEETEEKRKFCYSLLKKRWYRSTPLCLKNLSFIL